MTPHDLLVPNKCRRNNYGLVGKSLLYAFLRDAADLDVDVAVHIGLPHVTLVSCYIVLLQRVLKDLHF